MPQPIPLFHEFTGPGNSYTTSRFTLMAKSSTKTRTRFHLSTCRLGCPMSSVPPLRLGSTLNGMTWHPGQGAS